MDRLIERGADYICIKKCKKKCTEGYYEDEVTCKCDNIAEALNRLAHYEDMEEQGRKGCAWCNKGLRFECYLIDDDGYTASISGNMVQTVIADHCPVCGRKLKGAGHD